MVAAAVCLDQEMLRLIAARIDVAATSGQMASSEHHQPHRQPPDSRGLPSMFMFEPRSAPPLIPLSS